MHKQYLVCAFLSVGISLSTIQGQEHFELSAPQLGVKSQAVLTDTHLQVTGSSGVVTAYHRESRFDSPDGRWLAYFDRRANQVLRWPSTNAGKLQLGTPRGNAIEYRTSQMTIRSLPQESRARPTQQPVLPAEINSQALAANSGTNPFDGMRHSDLFESISLQQSENVAPMMLRLAALDQNESPWLLSRESASELRVVPTGSTLANDWWVAPAGNGYVRLETYSRGKVYAVSTTTGQSVGLQPLLPDARQLWKVRSGHAQQRFLLENSFFPGRCLTHIGAGQLVLQPIDFTPMQLWVPLLAPTAPTFTPFWRSVSREIRPNPALPPAQIELVNPHRYALVILLGDVRRGNEFETIRIEANASAVITLDRDAGATLVETVEIRSPTGLWDRQDLVTTIPSSAFYDISVYEEHLQSIAIDRTGKSPNPIEDVNYVPKSLGWFPLPAGQELPTRGTIDVYQRGVAANNPGAVRHLDLKQFDAPTTERPLESILNEFQSAPRRSF